VWDVSGVCGDGICDNMSALSKGTVGGAKLAHGCANSLASSSVDIVSDSISLSE
jgi:hypothetical protein